jgi:hypothetical protein
MTIWERIKTALTPLGVPMAQNVYQVNSGQDYEDLYLVYSLVVGTPESFADNKEIDRQQLIQVSIYSRDGLAVLPDVESAMLAAGFTAGSERELAFSETTRHFGLAKDFYYLEEK